VPSPGQRPDRRAVRPARPRGGRGGRLTRCLRLALITALALPAVSGCGSGDDPQAAAPPPGVIPQPASVEWPDAAGFEVSPQTRILVSPGNDAALQVAQMLAALIGRSVAEQPPDVGQLSGGGTRDSIQLALTGDDLGPEGYRLEVTDERVIIAAQTPAGLFYGVQSLRQLLPPFLEWDGVLPGQGGPVTAPAVRVTDRPRYPWRGAMLDVARHFLGVPDVKRFIDYLALYKMNRLHLHLTDDQGWRIEIASWPKLAAEGGSTAVGGGPGGYYTQAQYREIVDYAAERFIAVVPEIDLPSHINAALAAYPELNCDGVSPPPYTGIEVGFSMICPDTEATSRFVSEVFGELAAMTPTPWLHIGGDEAAMMTDEQYARFVERVQDVVAGLDKTAVGWDEIARAELKPDAIVQHWRPTNVPALAVEKGAAVILSPADRIYLDQKYTEQTPIGLNWAGNVGVRESYSWDPLTKFEGLPEQSILGVEAALWSETLVTIRDFEYLAFPRLPGAAEIGWSRAADRQWESYRHRLAAQATRWSAIGINYYRSPEVPWP